MRGASNQVRGFFLFASLLLIAACDGGSGGSTMPATTTPETTTPATTEAKVTLSGTVGVLAKPSSKPNNSETGTLHSAMSGGTIQIIDSKGVVIGTGTIAADGSYSVAVDKGTNYIIKAVNGNVCLKSYVEKADADKTVTVDPTSSAVVKVLSKKIGNDNLGEPGQDVSSVVANTDIPAIITAIKNSGLLTAIAQAIQSDIATNANYSSSTVTVGAVSTAGDDDANTVSLSITITITIVVNGQAVTLPNAPTGVTAASGDGQVTVSWSAATGATSYNLYYSSTAGTAGIKINGITTGTSYTLTGLTDGVTYYFIVTASNSGAESVGSTQISATPISFPINVTTVSSYQQIKVSWNAVSGATSYNVYSSTTQGVTALNGAKVSAGANTFYTYTGLTTEITYYFVVEAVNDNGKSPLSNEVSASPDLWVTKANMLSTRYYISSCDANGVIYSIGGTSGGNPIALVDSYDPATDTWTATTPLPSARSVVGCSSVGGIIYAIAGIAFGGIQTNIVEAYDPIGNTWTAKAPISTARSSHSTAVVSGIIYSIGGIGGTPSTAIDSVEAYDPATNTWTTKASLPTARYGLATAVVGGIIYAIGGKDSTPSLLATVDAYDPATNTWTSKASMSTGRQWFCASVINGLIYAIGGSGTGVTAKALSSVEAYDPATNTWTSKVSIPSARTAAGCSALNNFIYLYGGLDNNSNPLSSLIVHQ